MPADAAPQALFAHQSRHRLLAARLDHAQISVMSSSLGVFSALLKQRMPRLKSTRGGNTCAVELVARNRHGPLDPSRRSVYIEACMHAGHFRPTVAGVHEQNEPSAHPQSATANAMWRSPDAGQAATGAIGRQTLEVYERRTTKLESICSA